MRIFFRWFNGLKVAYKLMLISIFFMMPDSYMLYMFISGINANIQFAQMEKKGNEYQRPLEKLLELVPEFVAVSGRANAGDARASLELPAIITQVDLAFDSLAAVDARLGTTLQFTDDALARRDRRDCTPSAVKKLWEELKAGHAAMSPAEMKQQGSMLTSRIRTMITHAGDMSNLILDPDLDSYYLMDATLLALPQTQDRISTVLVDGADILNRQNGTDAPTPATQQARTDAAIHATMLQEADLDRIVGSIHTALNEDANFYGVSPSLQNRIPPALKEYQDSATVFITLTRDLSDDRAGQLSASDYVRAGETARAASFRLWEVADEELDVLLQARINDYSRRKTFSLGVAAAAFLAAVALVSFITRSISRPLTRQAEQLRAANSQLQAAHQKLEERIQARTAELQSEVRERQEAQARLDAAQEQLIRSAREADTAEAATSVLQNVGDVLNRVNVAVSMMTDNLRKSEVTTLANVSQMIIHHKSELAHFISSDERGKLIPYLIADVADCLQQEQASLLGELTTLAKGVENVTAIVSAQQAIAKGYAATSKGHGGQTPVFQV